MTRIIDRYVGKQVLVGTIFGVVVLTIVLVLGNVWKRLLDLMVEVELPFSIILQFIGYLLPFSFPFTIPWGFLTAVLLTFGRLSADNELVSLRMAGVSLTRICVSVFFVACLLSAACLYVNVSVAPESETAIKRITYNRGLADPLALLKAGKVTNIPGYVIYIGSREGSELRDFQMVMFDEKSGASTFVSASHVIVRSNREAKTIELDLRGVFAARRVAARRGQEGGSGPDAIQMNIQSAMSEPVISLEKLYEKGKKENVRMMNNGEIQQALDDGIDDPKKRSGLLTELHRRISFSLACVTFALVGVPLGVTAQRRETSIGFALSLMIGLVYFMFIIVADMFKEVPGAYPHLLMWAPNIIFMALGIWLFRRAARR
jgi:lipopolysaccharide export LptBFGC system permease protein LptF